jgi:hypothetical protein
MKDGRLDDGAEPGIAPDGVFGVLGDDGSS